MKYRITQCELAGWRVRQNHISDSATHYSLIISFAEVEQMTAQRFFELLTYGA